MPTAKLDICVSDGVGRYFSDILGPDLFCLMPPPTPHFSEGAGNEETETDFHLNFSFRLSQENSSQF